MVGVILPYRRFAAFVVMPEIAFYRRSVFAVKVNLCVHNTRAVVSDYSIPAVSRSFVKNVSDRGIYARTGLNSAERLDY